MKTDLYTKTILTVIAVCLTFICLRDVSIIPAAHANEAVANSAVVPLNPDGTITVRMAPNEEVHVDITNISTSDELEVNIEEVNGRSIYDAIPVEIDQ